jgi:hypothetical protein
MLAMTLQLEVVLDVVRLHNPRAWTIKMVSQCEEVRLACQLSMIFVLSRSRVIIDKIL